MTASHVIVAALLGLGFFVVGIYLSAERREDAAPLVELPDRRVVTAVALRLSVAPAVLALFSLLVVRLPHVYLLQAAMPTGISSLIVGHAYGLDQRMIATTIMWSTAAVLVVGTITAIEAVVKAGVVTLDRRSPLLRLGATTPDRWRILRTPGSGRKVSADERVSCSRTLDVRTMDGRGRDPFPCRTVEPDGLCRRPRVVRSSTPAAGWRSGAPGSREVGRDRSDHSTAAPVRVQARVLLALAAALALTVVAATAGSGLAQVASPSVDQPALPGWFTLADGSASLTDQSIDGVAADEYGSTPTADPTLYSGSSDYPSAPSFAGQNVIAALADINGTDSGDTDAAASQTPGSEQHEAEPARPQS